MKTPRTLTTNSTIGDRKKIFAIMAMKMPNTPIIRNEPKPVRSRPVV